jgi:hypothetical protein
LHLGLVGVEVDAQLAPRQPGVEVAAFRRQADQGVARPVVVGVPQRLALAHRQFAQQGRKGRVVRGLAVQADRHPGDPDGGPRVDQVAGVPAPLLITLEGRLDAGPVEAEGFQRGSYLVRRPPVQQRDLGIGEPRLGAVLFDPQVTEDVGAQGPADPLDGDAQRHAGRRGCGGEDEQQRQRAHQQRPRAERVPGGRGLHVGGACVDTGPSLAHRILLSTRGMHGADAAPTRAPWPRSSAYCQRLSTRLGY